MIDTYTHVYNRMIKMNEIMSFSGKWMDLEVTLLTEPRTLRQQALKCEASIPGIQHQLLAYDLALTKYLLCVPGWPRTLH